MATKKKSKKVSSKVSSTTPPPLPKRKKHGGSYAFSGDLKVPVQVNLSQEQKDNAVRAAMKLGVSLASFIRGAVLQAISETLKS